MITTDLYEKVLIEPVEKGADSLSGFASARMVYKHFHHFENPKRKKKKINISLIVGMIPTHGIDEYDHYWFKQLINNDYPQQFNCNYVINPPPNHSKAFIWCNNGIPIFGFVGSANYTVRAFSGNQNELVTSASNPTQLYDYYQSFLIQSLECNSSDIGQHIHINPSRNKKNIIRNVKKRQYSVVDNKFEFETLSLLDTRSKEVHNRSGLNWGHRPNRNKNQAYIPIPMKIQKSDFFPPKKEFFYVMTDDQKEFICTRAQEEYGKAIHTPNSNAEIGVYFRNRLGLADGAYVTTQDLINYGRTDVTFYKLDERTYLMDFSVPKRG